MINIIGHNIFSISAVEVWFSNKHIGYKFRVKYYSGVEEFYEIKKESLPRSFILSARQAGVTAVNEVQICRNYNNDYSFDTVLVKERIFSDVVGLLNGVKGKQCGCGSPLEPKHIPSSTCLKEGEKIMVGFLY